MQLVLTQWRWLRPIRLRALFTRWLRARLREESPVIDRPPPGIRPYL